MSTSDGIRLPHWAVAAMVAVLIATHGGIWALRESRIGDLEKEINTYKQSNDWKLPETLKKINAASEKLSLNIDKNNKLIRLEAESKDNLINIEKINNELKDVTLKLDIANKALAQVTTKNSVFTVKRRDSHQLLENSIFLSVAYVGSSNVTGKFNNQDYDLELGESLPYQIGNLSCKITLSKMSLQEEFATFNQSCISNG